MNLLVLDNYDSFTYNVVQRLGEIDSALDIQVFRNDEIEAEAALEAARERAKIDAASRLEEAENVGGQKLREELIDERVTSEHRREELDELAIDVLALIANGNQGSYRIIYADDGNTLLAGNKSVKLSHQNLQLFREAVDELTDTGLIDPIENEITADGYRFLEDRLKDTGTPTEQRAQRLAVYFTAGDTR